MLFHKAVKWLHRFFGTFEKRAHTSTDSVRLLHFYCNVASLSLSLWHLNHGRSIEKKVPNTAAILLWSYLSI